jgi:hypothetical protein
VSEYQYYEFLALDKPLTAKQRSELRELSTRAEITATRFVNEYHWGDFRGDPRQMMERYFDAFLYLANWGTRHLMFRLPRDVLDPETVQQYCYTDAASLTETDDHLVISLYSDRDSDDYWDETTGELGAMVQARSDLAAGDLRLLYLAWLLAIQWDDVDDDDTEPPVPAGLGNLSAALQAIVDFFEIDADLIAVAAEASPDSAEEKDDGLAEWVTSLPAAEKDKLLTMVAAGEIAQVRTLMRRRFRGNGIGRSAPSRPARTIADLWEAASSRKAEREKAEEQRQCEEQARQAAAKAATYEKRLDELAPRTEAAWKHAAELIEARSPREYDQATALLRDLYALAERQGDSAGFTTRFLQLRTQHARKPSLQERFDKAGLPREVIQLCVSGGQWRTDPGRFEGASLARVVPGAARIARPAPPTNVIGGPLSTLLDASEIKLPMSDSRHVLCALLRPAAGTGSGAGVPGPR